MAGVVKIKNNTRAVQKRIRGISGESLEHFTYIARAEAERTAPRRVHLGGNHANSIKSKLYGWKRNRKSAQIFSSSGYGVYLEFGTWKMEARPHFRPAIQLAIKRFTDNKLWGE
jgi:HK97 gp10 family phage protein